MSSGDASAHARADRSLRTAVGWNFSLNLGRRLTTTAVSFVLAGILGPAAFGTVAIASLYVVLVQLVFQQGFAPAIIQRKRIDDRVLDTAFQLVIVGSLVMTAVSVAVSKPLGIAMGDDQLPLVVCLLSLQLPVQALGVVQEGLLRRESDFRSLSIRTNGAVIAGGAIGLGAALAGAGIMSLVAQQLVTSVLATALVWTRTPWRPRFSARVSLRSKTARELREFAGKVSIASVAQLSAAQMDTIFIGALFGPVAVGLYRLAARLVETVLDLSLRTFQSAFLSDLAREARNGRVFADRCVFHQRVACTLAMPALGVLGGSGAAVLRLLGPDWGDAVVPLVLLALGSIGIVFTNIAIPALQAAGKPGDLLRLQLMAVGVTGLTLMGATIFMRVWDLDDLWIFAAARGASATLLAIPTLVALHRWIGLDYRGLLLSAYPGAIAALAAAGAGLSAHGALESGPLWMDLLGSFTVSVIGAGGIIVLLQRDFARAGLARLRRPSATPSSDEPI